MIRLLFLALVACAAADFEALDWEEHWDYVTVRPRAHMFYWFFTKENAEERPIIVWLQGGPGASSTGYGNFDIVGPYNYYGELREETWLDRADLLFVDNPVGAGYSYVDDPSELTTTNQEIGEDLTALTIAFMEKFPERQNSPFYILGESYGGKMVTSYALNLKRAMDDGEVNVNLKGIMLGDSWISPMDSVENWSTYLWQLGRLGIQEYNQLQGLAEEGWDYVNEGRWEEARDIYFLSQNVIFSSAFIGQPPKRNSPWYNVLEDTGEFDSPYPDKDEGLLTSLMNNEMREKFGIIPDSLTWSPGSGEVFEAQRTHFMRPVLDDVDEILEDTDIHIFIYNGQLDLIVPTSGQLEWIRKLQWSKLQQYMDTPQENVRGSNLASMMFVREYDQLHFYWVHEAGHMVPADQPKAGMRLLERMLEF